VFGYAFGLPPPGIPWGELDGRGAGAHPEYGSRQENGDGMNISYIVGILVVVILVIVLLRMV
jgi:hypothetical protein